ncbi:betaine aldehyde dehydrogenase, NAD-dependent [metagenome]|uniref:Betaine aldehyde dehydrogenase, NAD-dependent n=1 Tax=metagenome TaxID=256318 RepID=A0A2P2CD80_9ZZZZ
MTTLSESRRNWVTTRRDLLIGGRAVEAAGRQWSVTNPATGHVLGQVAGASLDQVDQAVAAARAAFPAWAALTGDERSRWLHHLADVLAASADDLVASIVNEIGTPVSMAASLQVGLPIEEHVRWAAEAAKRDRTVELGPYDLPHPTMSDVVYEPAGVVAAVTAYNYPLSLATFKFGAALASGCTVVLLPSPRAPLSSLLIADLVEQAGLPDGVFNVILGLEDVGVRLTSHPGVDRVSFTGSDAVGASIMAQAATRLTPVTLELGGKSPTIVMPDVDLDDVVGQVHRRWSRNGGQGCAALARLLVHRSRYDEFLEKSGAAFDEIVVGDPWDPRTTVGPMIDAAHRARVEGFVSEAVGLGATVAASSHEELPEAGWFTRAVLLDQVTPEFRVVREEVFGPVAVMLPFVDEDDAVRLANDSEYGLAANVWCADPVQARRMAGRIRAGTVWINGGGGMRPDAPFGGYGRSGVGRELGEWGMHEFLEPKHIQWRI